MARIMKRRKSFFDNKVTAIHAYNFFWEKNILQVSVTEKDNLNDLNISPCSAPANRAILQDERLGTRAI
jgi:hypothetical protein